jgi:hypothetical protein
LFPFEQSLKNFYRQDAKGAKGAKRFKVKTIFKSIQSTVNRMGATGLLWFGFSWRSWRLGG